MAVLGDVQEKKDQMMDQLQTKQLFIYLWREYARVWPQCLSHDRPQLRSLLEESPDPSLVAPVAVVDN